MADYESTFRKPFNFPKNGQRVRGANMKPNDLNWPK